MKKELKMIKGCTDEEIDKIEEIRNNKDWNGKTLPSDEDLLEYAIDSFIVRDILISHALDLIKEDWHTSMPLLCVMLKPNCGHIKFYKFLRERGIINHGSTKPAQDYIDLGWFTPDCKTAIVTSLGQVNLHMLWKKYNQTIGEI